MAVEEETESMKYQSTRKTQRRRHAGVRLRMATHLSIARYMGTKSMQLIHGPGGGVCQCEQPRCIELNFSTTSKVPLTALKRLDGLFLLSFFKCFPAAIVLPMEISPI